MKIIQRETDSGHTCSILNLPSFCHLNTSYVFPLWQVCSIHGIETIPWMEQNTYFSIQHQGTLNFKRYFGQMLNI